MYTNATFLALCNMIFLHRSFILSSSSPFKGAKRKFVPNLLKTLYINDKLYQQEENEHLKNENRKH